VVELDNVVSAPRLVMACGAVLAPVPPLEMGRKVPDGVAALVGIIKTNSMSRNVTATLLSSKIL
jgi:hypothetical protein